ncbi:MULTISPECIES: DinB family protein [Paenibacillus]|uniref:DinB family protein n=1 Tax=Paenibacillus TaxID=44249 RepID=UPI00073F975F|nr:MULTISPECIES: DinB family protein [Paenibacillus]MDU4698326.1 DinB family protein [Paenibacillus sp.]
MLKMFQYNWQVRDEWFHWCENVPEEELLRKRVGGFGNILETLFHIADVEWSWIRTIQGKPDFQEDFKSFMSLELVKKLSDSFHTEVEAFLQTWTNDMDGLLVTDSWGREFTQGEILRHVIAHEIHHIGQLSVWSRELGLAPVSPNFINRGIR